MRGGPPQLPIGSKIYLELRITFFGWTGLYNFYNILLFDSEKESIYLSQRVLLSQRRELSKTGNLSIKSICILPVEKLNKAKNEIAKYYNC